MSALPWAAELVNIWNSLLPPIGPANLNKFSLVLSAPVWSTTCNILAVIVPAVIWAPAPSTKFQLVPVVCWVPSFQEPNCVFGAEFSPKSKLVTSVVTAPPNWAFITSLSLDINPTWFVS